MSSGCYYPFLRSSLVSVVVAVFIVAASKLTQSFSLVACSDKAMALKRETSEEDTSRGGGGEDDGVDLRLPVREAGR